MKNAIILIFVFLSSCLFSCGNRTIVCSKEGIHVSGVGFTKADVGGSAILYSYKKDNAFDSLADSVKFYFPAPESDTFTMNPGITGDYDYKLLFPASNAVYEITSIAYSGNKTQSIQQGFLDNNDYVCYMQLASYAVNSTVYTSAASTNPITGDTIYVRK